MNSKDVNNAAFAYSVNMLRLLLSMKLINEEEYQRIVNAEYCEKAQTKLKDKFFVSLHGALMEVSEEFYKEFYRNKRREQYIKTRSLKRELYYQSLDSDYFSGEEILNNPEEDICTQVLNKMMIEQLKQAIQTLSEEEKVLLDGHYKEELSETELAQIYGVSQQAISKRLIKIREKLKNLLKI